VWMMGKAKTNFKITEPHSSLNFFLLFDGVGSSMFSVDQALLFSLTLFAPKALNLSSKE